MSLRPYQGRTVEAVLQTLKRTVSPICFEAATGAGKSHMIAAIAEAIHKLTGKRVLVLAPSAELVTQNMEKYLATGARASMFSASAGGKDLRHPVVFGSPLTVKNHISRFCQGGEKGFALVLIDECQGITETVQDIITEMRKANPLLRVVGTSATLYRLGYGYIFTRWPDGRINGEETSRDPYFTDCVAQVTARELIDSGYLTPPIIGQIGAEGYDTAALIPNSAGKFKAEAIDQAYHGHGRKTAAIVADVVAKSRDRRGVMFFAATIQHAQEVMASLPPALSAMVTGKTPKAERAKIIAAFKAQRLKYLVNVSVLTTGFDAPHVDVVAILRKTESVGLLQQIIGRGLRLFDGKTDCLVLDYTDNLATHCPDGDLFSPVIRARGAGEAGGGMSCVCPTCQHENTFTANPKYLDYKTDAAGYILDLDGHHVMTEHGPIPGHLGRRCVGLVQSGSYGEWSRCGYRWTFKPCPHCEAENDIAARYCRECKGEIIDPNEKLAIEFKALKRDPTKLQTDDVVGMNCAPGVSRNGNRTLRVEFVTAYRQFVVWLQPDARHTRSLMEFDLFDKATEGGRIKPRSVTYRKDPNTGFYQIHAYNRPADAAPDLPLPPPSKVAAE